MEPRRRHKPRWPTGINRENTESQAEAINNRGEIVGDSCDQAFTCDATEWSRGKVFNLGALPGYTNSIATGINDRGQVVGYSYNRGGGFSATEWSRGDVINLGGLPGYTDSFAYAINDRGQVAGQSGNSLLSSRATEWSGGAVINLGTLPGTSGSAAFAINESGQAVGVSVTFNDADTATLWTDGSVKNLGALSPNFYSSASSINDAGQVVGWSDPDGQAALWNDGTVIDLNTDISSLYRWILTDATAINDGGQIAGYGLNPLGQYEGFLLTPCATSCPIPAIIPEPSTWAMMLLGFAGLGFTGCRGARAGSTTMLAAQKCCDGSDFARMPAGWRRLPLRLIRDHGAACRPASGSATWF